MAKSLIADSGSSKTEWYYSNSGKVKKMTTQGLSPYFVSPQEMQDVFTNKVLKTIGEVPDEVFFLRYRHG